MNASLLLLTLLAAGQVVSSNATVTLPLAEVLPLMVPAKEEQAPRPPVSAVLVHQSLIGSNRSGVGLSARSPRATCGG